MVRYGENFFKSLGFAPLPETFWERSLFMKPRDREVVCHASAWDVDNKDDLRLKMCIDINDEDFVTVHHELGHNFYQRAYNKQPYLFQNGANDGFHEAIGDTIALSITPEYLKQVGLLQTVPKSDDTSFLLRRAMDKVAFLPFGLMIDQWRWKVMDGSIKPADYNKGWWELREKYQGVAPPVARSENDFDPGAKYHVPANVPYTRYFLARILQFQFYRALCAEAGYQGPLHQCSFYGNKQAGAKLNAMLELGMSKPWPEALKAMTGEDRIDAARIAGIFCPAQEMARRTKCRGKHQARLDDASGSAGSALRARARITWHFAEDPRLNSNITGELAQFSEPGILSPAGRGGGRASAALLLLDDVTTSPASQRLASAHPALAPKCQVILARTLRACDKISDRTAARAPGGQLQGDRSREPEWGLQCSGFCLLWVATIYAASSYNASVVLPAAARSRSAALCAA